ncbi:MAG: hypothetical protein Q9190_002350 [Brigantiaea leucoxantha]
MKVWYPHLALQAHSLARFLPPLPCHDCAQKGLLHQLRYSSCLALVPSSDVSIGRRTEGASEKVEAEGKDRLIQERWANKKLRHIEESTNGFGSEKDWREYLKTFEDYELHSDLHNSEAWLLDNIKYAADFQLWLELLRFRKRIHGTGGLKVLWDGFVHKGLRIPTCGRIADELWELFLSLGFEDQDILKEIIRYAKKLKYTTGSQWPRLYATILAHHLRFKPARVWTCHHRLQKHFLPSQRQFQSLFTKSLSSEQARQVYLDLHKGLSPGYRIYDVAIPEFCRQNMYSIALQWHRALVSRNDLPSSAKVSQPLLRHLTLVGRSHQALQIAQDLANAGVPSIRSSDQQSRQTPILSREMVSKQLAEIQGVRGMKFDDAFCARLFATKAFSIGMVMNGLRMLGVEEIGPASLREIGMRERRQPYAIYMKYWIQRLRQLNISIGQSTFSILVRRLADEDDDQVLKDVIKCDLHLDTFDDTSLQESLLASYQKNGEEAAINRTLAILTAKVQEQYTEHARWNLVLRGHLTRRDVPEIFFTIDKMQELCIPFEHRSSNHVRVTLMSRRFRGKRPRQIKDLILVINIWITMLRSGGFVPPLSWREIFRRLGMCGCLARFERLAMWLADWYSSSIARRGMTLSSGQRSIKAWHPATQFGAGFSRLHHLHPLRMLFPPSLQQGIVAWGFQHAVSRSRFREPSWTWGLQLLRNLEHRGVVVQRQVVERAVGQRMQVLFGKQMSRRRINQRERTRNQLGIEAYVEKARQICGRDLFGVRGGLLGFMRWQRVATRIRGGSKMDRARERAETSRINNG